MSSILMQKPVRYISAGRFMSEDEWTHPKRVLDHDVLLLGLQGCVHIASGEARYFLRPSSYVLLPAGIPHYGYESDAGVGYYWVHFSSGSGQGGPLELDGFGEDIPTENALLLFRQLLHFANRAQLSRDVDQALNDYTLTALLLELRYQADLRRRASENQRDNFQEILEWIRINLSRDITLTDVADTFHYRPKYFSHLFSKKMGISFKRYLIERRVTLACSLLSNTSGRVSDIALRSGFGDEKHFMKTFKQITGMTPTTYRQSINRTHLNNE